MEEEEEDGEFTANEEDGKIALSIGWKQNILLVHNLEEKIKILHQYFSLKALKLNIFLALVMK